MRGLAGPASPAGRAQCAARCPLRPEGRGCRNGDESPCLLPGSTFPLHRDSVLGAAPRAAEEDLLEKSRRVSTVLLKFWRCWGRSSSQGAVDKALNTTGPRPPAKPTGEARGASGDHHCCGAQWRGAPRLCTGALPASLQRASR